MRLQEVYIRGCRVLDDFTLKLEKSSVDTHALDLLVGVNGTGKSTLLRALSEIFQSLDQGKKPKFGFRVAYQLQIRNESTGTIESQSITISNLNDAGELESVRLWVDAQEQTVGEEKRPIERIDYHYLPRWVIAFTSGSERGWELPENAPDASVNGQQNGASLPSPDASENMKRLKDWYLSEQVGKPVVAKQDSLPQPLEKRFLFISSDLIPLVVLCGLLQDMAQKDMAQKNKAQHLDARRKERHSDFVDRALRECKLVGLRGFSLKFRMNRDVISPLDQDFIEKLSQKAHHSIQRGSDYLLVFSLEKSREPGTQPAKGVVKPEEVFVNDLSCIPFFEKLVSLQKPGRGASSILREVHLFFAGDRQPQVGQRTQQDGAPLPQSPLLLFDWLSDGEQSFLGRLCLFALFEADAPQSDAELNQEDLASEALILLDEPEVHFNDYWKRQLVRMLTEALQKTPRHVLMTTHSSITLSDVADANIWILQREDDHTKYADPPNIRTLGADPSDILVQVFGAENAVGAQSVEYILQTIKDAREQRYKRGDKAASLVTLRDLRDKLGPGYWRFLVRQELEYLEQKG
jgi:predicted ATP-binding protein involved in virulence